MYVMTIYFSTELPHEEKERLKDTLARIVRGLGGWEDHRNIPNAAIVVEYPPEQHNALIRATKLLGATWTAQGRHI